MENTIANIVKMSCSWLLIMTKVRHSKGQLLLFKFSRTHFLSLFLLFFRKRQTKGFIRESISTFTTNYWQIKRDPWGWHTWKQRVHFFSLFFILYLHKCDFFSHICFRGRYVQPLRKATPRIGLTGPRPASSLTKKPLFNSLNGQRVEHKNSNIPDTVVVCWKKCGRIFIFLDLKSNKEREKKSKWFIINYFLGQQSSI